MTVLLLILAHIIGLGVLLKAGSWFRTVLYSTIFAPRIITNGEGFYIKVRGRILFFLTAYIRRHPNRWGRRAELWSVGSYAVLTRHLSNAYLFTSNEPKEIIDAYLKRYETKVYKRLNKKKYTGVTLSQWNKARKHLLQEKFVNDDIDHQTFINELNQLQK